MALPIYYNVRNLRVRWQVTLLSVLTDVPGDDAGGFEGSVYSPEEIETVWKAELAEAGQELERTAAALSGAPALTCRAGGNRERASRETPACLPSLPGCRSRARPR